ncbi:copper amine oxidase N-terminal domain-containing protein [Tepidibacter formicigenes]|jgi:type 1 fimbria pilin|uniref:Copper amine oxidase N-terminal domain-containing protein n=1 Tax=Tepidibacter formicigenes DSM 15518 TaxID=1123349 RepID=A0A1M6SU46_9FIRM|nr:copper amine oxidase N-terminal domain-containing protein [Tepidibacter formicigenes]SHK48167.1 Copper amine oxidase N-terminal domain-containing protein [Tepidibacter formicigenes DSM 15518]
MKRKILALSLIILLFLSGFAFGSGYNKKITAYFYNIKVSLNGKSIDFANEPFIYEDTTYVPLRDISESLGVNVYWDNQSKTIYMHSDDTSYSNNKYELEILKSQLREKEKEIEKLKDDDDDNLEDLEDELEDDYDEYTKGNKDLEFTYSLSQLSNDNIRVKMYGDFDRKSSAWDDRDNSEFRDFIEDICDEIRKEFREDIEVIVYDEDKDRCAEYKYDYSDKDLEKKYEY